MQPLSPVFSPSLDRRSLGIDEVRLDGGIWSRFQERNRRATLPHIARKLESEGWIGNFDLAARGALPAGRRGREFSDSEVYKFLEALAWELGREEDAEGEELFRATVARVGAAQEPDGYLNTRFGREGQGARWSDLEWGHELYCLGHLFQAAVARERTRPGSDDGLLDIAVRAADLIVTVFGDDSIRGICGHPEVEVGLAELARVTGTGRYLMLAKAFVDRRGHGILADIEWGRKYFQDDVPLRDSTVLAGHSVRANYLAAGAVDVATDTDDEPLLGALRRQWDATRARRTYLTGGQGSHHQDEAFGEDWELPPDRAYSETCAGVGSIMFSWRLLHHDLDSRYADLIERTLFNVIATSPGNEGTTFFYANTLHQRVPGEESAPDETSPRASSSTRSSWFEVSCCPPNVARTLASLGAYVATTLGDALELHQFASADIRTILADGRAVAVRVTTDYPASGRVDVEIIDGPSEAWALTIRVPAWARRATVQVRDGERSSMRAVKPGYITERRSWRPGDHMILDLPMGIRVAHPDRRIDAVRGCVAIERGPEVYAAQIPAGHGDVSTLSVDLAHGVEEAEGKIRVTVVDHAADPLEWPYGAREGEHTLAGRTIDLIPYRSWGNDGLCTMRVWLPTV